MNIDNFNLDKDVQKHVSHVAKPGRRKLFSLRSYKRILLATAFFLSLGLVVAGLLIPPLMRETKLMSLKRRQNMLLASFGMTIPGTPDLANLDRRLEQKGLTIGSPVLIRIFKREFELELWMMNKDKHFELFATYPICNWSGILGPKLATGDKQAPEGFYWVDRGALNPNSRQHRSFNLGFPNIYDRSYGRTGHALMVHGGCTSVGCFAMTDNIIDEIWSIINPAFDSGQKRFQVQVYPFRMTKDNLRRFANSNWIGFWDNLKVGHDLFEADRLPPEVNVCDKVYAFSSSSTSDEETAPILAQCK